MRQCILLAKVATVLLVLVLLFHLNVARNSTHASPDNDLDISTNVKDVPDAQAQRNTGSTHHHDHEYHAVRLNAEAINDHNILAESVRATWNEGVASGTGQFQNTKDDQWDNENSASPNNQNKVSSEFKLAYTTKSWISGDRQIEHYVIDRSSGLRKDFTSVLHLTITRDEESWGRNPNEAMRTIYDHLNMVTNTTLHPEQVSLGLLTASRTEYERYIKIFTPHSSQSASESQTGAVNSTYFDFAFRRVTLILHTADTRASLPGKKGTSMDTSRDARHSIPQHERRAILAKLRNYLQFIALNDETHVAWLDSDVYKYSSDTMMQVMAERTTTTDEVEIGILTARCQKGEPELADAWLRQHPDFSIPRSPQPGDSPARRREIEEMRGMEGGRFEIIAHKTNAMGHYDLNAWAGRRTSPNVIQQEALWEDISSWTPSGAERGLTKILDDVIEGTNNNEVRQLDSVGGTIIMIRADLIKMGLNFPTGYFVGMTFEHGEGFDGIETEGLCLLSRSFSRDGNSTCYTLGGDWAVWHTVF